MRAASIFFCIVALPGIFLQQTARTYAELLTRLPPIQQPETQQPEVIDLAPEALASEPVAPLLASNWSMSLADFEGLALASNPGIARTQALIQAAKCECLQVGLRPNPTVGYVANEIGNEGQAGQQGFFIGQKFIRGNKLEWNRAVASEEIRKREQQLASQQQRALTQVRTAYFSAYLVQLELELATKLMDLSEKSSTTAQDLIQAKEGRPADLLLAEIEVERSLLKQTQALNRQQQAWRQLAALAGQPQLAVTTLEADIHQLAWTDSWEVTLQSLLAQSPEVATAAVEVNKRRKAICLECAKAVPDVNAQVGVQYDDATHDTVTSVQVSFPVPIWNRNQGGIGKARAELVAARRALDTTELRLEQTLATQFQKYQSAKAKADTFKNEILPRADRGLKLLNEGYKAGEMSFFELFTAQRTYFQANLEYIEALKSLNQSVHLLKGLLLSGSTDSL